jgi:hypothetical protein
LMGEVRHESGHSFIEPSLVIVAKIVFSWTAKTQEEKTLDPILRPRVTTPAL